MDDPVALGDDFLIMGNGHNTLKIDFIVSFLLLVLFPGTALV